MHHKLWCPYECLINESLYTMFYNPIHCVKEILSSLGSYLFVIFIELYFSSTGLVFKLHMVGDYFIYLLVVTEVDRQE